MAIRLIALDLDGTLLTSDKRVSDRNRQALERCARRGIHIVPATGRMPASMPKAVRELFGVRYAISANGASVDDMRTGNSLVKNSIFWEDALRIIDLVRPYPVMYDSYIEGLGKTDNRFLEHLDEYVDRPEQIELIRTTRSGIPDLRAYIETNHPAVDKINVTFRDEETRRELRGLLEKQDGIVVTSSVPNNLELNSSKAGKGEGLAFLTEYLHLKRDETMAFGDEENDLSMIKQAGLGVAMGNGIAALREQADFVTRSNDEDGVAAAIERFVLQGA